MSSHARCLCVTLGWDAEQKRPAMARATDCPIHGDSNPDPVVPWRLSFNDRDFLRKSRIRPE